MDFVAGNPQLQKERLSALRAELSAQQLDGFFIPLADEYLNEYVPPHAQRLAWLTGFTGSAGFAVVLKDKAALFTDGRYTLQAAQETDGHLYEHRHITRAPIDAFLKENVCAGHKIGYDPWLHTRASIEKYRTVVEGNGGKLVAVSSNPVDGLWHNRPAPPTSSVLVHPLCYAGEEAAAKILRLAKELGERKCDAAVVTAPASAAWLLNVRGHDVENTPLPFSTFILGADGGVHWFVAGSKVSADVQQSLPACVAVKSPDTFLPSLKELGRKKAKVRVDGRGTPSAVLDALSDSGAVLDESGDVCELPRACKNMAELEGMRAAHRTDGLALTRFLCWFSAHGVGLDEIALEERLLAFRQMDKAFLYPSFPSISGAGPNGAIVHYRASEKTKRILQVGELYLIDSGGQYACGTTDVTRTLACGRPTPDMKRHFTLVLKGHIALAQARFPQGISGNQLDVLARRALWGEGLDYDHGTGHGVGAFLGVHEGPQGISSRNAVPLRAGMVLSNEPGYYRAGAYGIRIENLMAVRESALRLENLAMLEFETLTLAPIDKNLIDALLLDTAEKTWLNAYHARVLDAHAPLLTDDERSWLKAATRPL